MEKHPKYNQTDSLEMIANAPNADPKNWKKQPNVNPQNLPQVLNNQPLGTEESAAPIKKTPIVKAANEFDAPKLVADKGPTVVNKVEVDKVKAHASANRRIFQYGFELVAGI